MIVGNKRLEGHSHRIILGGAAGGLLHTDPDTSVLVLGPPRSTGKTAGVLIPAVLTARGPVVVVSTKNDVFAATALHRRRSGKVFCFSPDGSPTLPGAERVVWSPIGGNWGDCLARSTWMVEAANMNKGRDSSSFWESRASDLLAVVLFYAGLRAKDMHWVVQTIGTFDLKGDFEPMVADLASLGHPMASGILRGIIHGGDRTRADIFATASVVLRPFLLPGALSSSVGRPFDIATFVAGDPHAVSDLLEESPLNCDMVDGRTRQRIEKPWKDWIKQRGRWQTIYITASEQNLKLVAPLIIGFLGDIQRQVYAQHAHDSLYAPGWRRPPVLWVLDEMSSIPIPNLPVLLRDCGSQGLLIVGAMQSLTQSAVWGEQGKALQTLFNSVLVLSGIRDRESLELLSLLCGDFDQEVWSGSYSGRGKEREWNPSVSIRSHRRLTPDDIYRGNPMDPDAALLFARNGWQWVTLQLYYRTGLWPVLLQHSVQMGCRNPWIAVSGLPYPDLARNEDYRILEAISPQFASNYARGRIGYYQNLQRWHWEIARSHDEALHENAQRGRRIS